MRTIEITQNEELKTETVTHKLKNILEQKRQAKTLHKNIASRIPETTRSLVQQHSRRG